MRWINGIAIGLLVVLAGLAVFLWSPRTDRLDRERVEKAVSVYDVEIIRDQWGVPHIFGTSDADTAFGLAYAHAEDDFETIQLAIAAGRGRLARYQGLDAAPTDYIVSLMGIWDTIDARYETDVPDDVKRLAMAYADGLNLYASHHPGESWAGLAPFTPQDVVAGFMFKTPFFYGFDGTLLELFEGEGPRELALDPANGPAFEPVEADTPTGSNAFAVAPSRSGDGHTRLMINSHQPLTGPVAWYEAHLVSEEGLDITGGLFPGTPLILHGFNRDLGWANTVNKPDLVDIYQLTVNPDNPDEYRLDGDWVPFEETEARIDIGLWGPFAFTANRPVRRSAHGPVVEREDGVYAIRYAGMGEIRQLEQYYRLNHAGTLTQFLQAMEMNALPSINYLYADKNGNIAFIHNAQYPARQEGWNWNADLPGDRSDLIWAGYRPFGDVPKLINPASGFLYNANNTPFSATDGSDDLQPEEFSASMGLETHQTNRAWRVLDLTARMPVIGRNELLAIKFDVAYAPQSDAVALINDVLAMDWSGDPALADAARHLAEWDCTMPAESRHAALAALTFTREVTAQFTGVEPPAPATAFREAVDWLMNHHGRIDPEWGEVNRLVRGEVSLPLDGASGTLRSVHPESIGADGILKMTAGDSWIGFVEWDENGQVRADVIHQYGSATLDPTSPHYADQAPLFAAGQWRRALLARSEIEANATRVYRPQEVLTKQ